jgi:hypothetical protein
MAVSTKKGTRLACFSPPVMLATFCIEIVFTLYTLWRYHLDWVGRLAAGMLFLLGFFQLSEYYVCGGLGMSSATWARAGYVAITMLLPLGLHLLHVLAGKKTGRLVVAAYVSALGFIAFFLGYDHAFAGYVCTGNYVIFQLAVHSGMAYGIFYYGWLLTSVGLGLRWAHQLARRGKKFAQRRRNVLALAVGYLIFMVPTAVANTVSPATRHGIPSIMCGFAVLFACILVAYILPGAGRRRQA